MSLKHPKISPGTYFLRKKKALLFTASCFLIALMALNMFGLLIRGSNKYFSTDYWKRYPELKRTYYNSVYANKKGNFPRDEVLYAFNGGALITGTNPILINPEVPPAGKYIVGLSILLFKNEHMMTFLFGIASLVLMFLVSKQISNSVVLSLLPATVVTFEPFFRNQFIYTPLFDIIQLVFLLAIFYFFNKGLEKKSKSTVWFIASSIFVGLYISTKFFATGIPIVGACIIVLIINREYRKVLSYSSTLPIAIVILLGSYVRVLMIGYPLLKFLGIQKWIFWYNQGHLHNLFSVWPLLLSNYWIQGVNKISEDPQWRISWPLSTLFTGIVSFGIIVNKSIRNKNLEVLVVWSILYLGLLSFSDASARYFVILIPILFIISMYGIKQGVIEIVKKYENRN